MLPLLFVDIDGVLNPYGRECPDGFVDHWLFPHDDEPVRVCPTHGAWLHELAGHYELVWGTGWSAEDRAVLSGMLDLPRFNGAAQTPHVPFDPSLKTPAVSLLAGDRPAAWIDDVMTPEAWAWSAARAVPTLLIPVRAEIGPIRAQEIDRSRGRPTQTDPLSMSDGQLAVGGARS